MSSIDRSIVHLTFDYPDEFAPEKTIAVKNLIQVQTAYHNIVVSLNRTANPFADFSPKKEPNGYSMMIFGLPFGIGLSLWMYLASKRITRLLGHDWESVHLIHAHKLTFEGIIAFWLSRKLKKPCVVTVRGDSDLRVIKAKKELRFLFKATVNGAARIIFLAPWSERALHKYIPRKCYQHKAIVIPNIIAVTRDDISATARADPVFISVFRLDSYKRKNIKRIINAIDELHEDYPEIGLDIVGSGTEKSVRVIRGYINSCRFPDRFRMLGNRAHADVLQMYRQYAGLILPSNPETFGLVFIEALNAGLPVIYAEEAGVDGFFDGLGIGVRVRWDDDVRIKDAIRDLYLNQSKFKAAVREYLGKGGLAAFSADVVGSKYRDVLSEVMTYRSDSSVVPLPVERA